MTTKTHYTTASTWTPPAWVTKCRAVVAGGKGGDASGLPGTGGVAAVLTAILGVSASMPVGVGSIAGGLRGSSGAGAGGAASTFGGVTAGGGGGSGATVFPSVGQPFAYSGGSGGLNGYDAQAPFDAAAGKGAIGATGGAGGTASGSTAGGTGQSNAAGGTGGNGGASGGYGGGGGGGGFAGGGGGATSTIGSDRIGAGGGGGSSSYGAAEAIGPVGFNDGAPYIDIFIAGAPKVPTLLGPTGNAWADRTASIVLSFQHNSDTPGDALDVQTDAEVRYRKYNVGASWTTVDELGTDTAISIAANTLDAAQYEWQARTKADGAVGDAMGVWGPWSTSEYFQAATPPSAPTIISPESSDTIQIATVTAEWTAPGQVEYQARLVGDNAGVADESVIYSDTGVKSGAATTATLAAMTNHVAAHVQVRIRTISGGLWSAWADVPVSIEWAGPPTPRVTLATDVSSIHVTVTNPPPVGVEPVADRIEIYVIEGETRERRAILAPGDGWVYETPPSGVEVGIEAVAIYTPTNVMTSSGVIF